MIVLPNLCSLYRDQITTDIATTRVPSSAKEMQAYADLSRASVVFDGEAETQRNSRSSHVPPSIDRKTRRILGLSETVVSHADRFIRSIAIMYCRLQTIC